MNNEHIAKLKVLVMRFKENMELENYSNRTVRDYVYQLKFFVAYLQKSDLEDVQSITKETIHQYQMHLYTTVKNGKQLGLEAQYGRLVPVKSLFKYLVKQNLYLYDPASDIELPKRKRNLPKGIMTRKEVYRVLNQPDPETALGLRDRALMEVLYATGIRNAELRNVTVYDVDIGNQELRINQGKGRKDRVVPLGAIASKYMDHYLKEGRTQLLAYAEKVLKYGKAETNLLFISKGAKQLTAANLCWLIAKYVKKAKLSKHITPHCFRHTCATHMLKGRAQLRHIQALLGHGSIATTQIYTHVEVSDLKKEHRRSHPREKAL